jgi:hypothetical protein
MSNPERLAVAHREMERLSGAGTNILTRKELDSEYPGLDRCNGNH